MARTLSLYMRMLCTALFCTFSVVYLYCYQTDILFRLQHAASDGQTYYVPVVGALLITVVMKLLQVGVFAITRLYKRWHAMTYLPSCLILAMLTSLEVGNDGSISYGCWWWVAPLVLCLYIIIMWIAHDNQPIEPALRSSGVSSQLIWINVLQLSVMFLGVVLVGCHDEQAHIQAHAQRIMFTNVRHFAARKAKQEEQKASSEKKKTKKEPAENVDSTLCRMLMDKQLDGFASKVKRSYDLNKGIPTVYAEALQLYMNTAKRPRYYWHNRKLSERLDSFMAERARAEETKNRNALNRHFGDTYWLYYVGR